MHKQSNTAWCCQLLWQVFWFSMPAWVDFAGASEWCADNLFDGDYKRTVLYSFAFFLNLGWILPAIVFGTMYVIKHPFFEQYRSQNWVWDQEESVLRTKYMKMLVDTFFSFLIGQFAITFSIIKLGESFMSHTSDQAHIKAWLLATPTAWESFWKQMVACLVFETLFYWGHRWLHTPGMYAYHKKHHQYYVPTTWAGHYGDFIDGLVSLPIPAIVPVLFLNAHPVTLWSYSILQSFHSCYDHCGYNFPFNPFNLVPFGATNDAHNYHHHENIDNFGLFWRFWDDLMGTNASWEKFRAKRDEMFDKMQAGETFEDEEYLIQDGVMVLKLSAADRAAHEEQNTTEDSSGKTNASAVVVNAEVEKRGRYMALKAD